VANKVSAYEKNHFVTSRMHNATNKNKINEVNKTTETLPLHI